MRIAALLPCLLAAVPAVTAAEQGKLGIALGNKNVNGQCKTVSDYEADFDALRKVTTLVRTYSASDCDTAKNIIPAAKNKKFQVVLGVWPDYDDSFNKDFGILKQYVHGNEDVVYGITVGSEVLYRGGLSPAKLKERIIQVVDEFPKVTVGTVDSWNKFADGTYDDIIASPKINYFLANGFAYWQGQAIDNATNTYFDDMRQARKRIESKAGRKVRFGNGETGWPTTGGTDYEKAVAKTEYAQEYWKSAVCGILTWGVDVFYFEAFDEPWKPVSKGDNGEEKDETHWDLDPSVPSANSAHSPPPHSRDPSRLRDASYLAAPLISSAASPGASSRSAAGSPRDRSVTSSNPSNSIPTVSKYRGAWDSSTSSPENKKAESSIYYTTAWGSPYAAPSPRRLSWSLSQSAGIDRGSGISSRASMRSGFYHGSEANHTEFLRPSAPESSTTQLYGGDSTLDRSPRRDLLGRKGGKSIKDFTQDWINQYLSGQPRTERSNWLSDDSGSEAPSFFTAQNHFADDPSDDWLALEQDSRDEDLLKTPTLSDFVKRRTIATHGENSLGRQRTKDYLHRRADTLRQEDFWGFAYDKDPQPITMADTKEGQPPTSHPEPSHAPSPNEKPLPPPPADAGKEDNIPAKPAEATEPNVTQNKVPSGRNTSAPVPKRKKILWRGKACIIGLPPGDRRGTEESGYRLLTVEDVEQKLKDWEEKGYSVRGFDVGAPEDSSEVTELGGLSRPSFPDTPENEEDHQTKGGYSVKFPNRDVWDSYVRALQEEKLRALGVSLGEEEMQPSVSPAMSQMAPFPGMGPSPPIPTASAASNPLSAPNPFSPHFNQSANNSNGIGSLASPVSHFGVQTPFLGVDQNLLPGYHVPFQNTPPAQGTLTPQNFFNARHANNPGLPGTLPDLTSMLSPVSPMNGPGAFHPGLNEQPDLQNGAFHEQHMDHHVQDNAMEGHLLRPVHTPTENMDNFHASTVEIAQPTPRGSHSRGHNLSETLQKGLDQIAQSDYHLEESIERQLEEGDHEPAHNFGAPGLMHSQWALPENNNRDIQHLPQHVHQFYGGGYSGHNAQEGSDIDTNPSLSGTPRRHNPLASHIPWHSSKPSGGSYPGHRSKLSSSTLNVDAKEFDPTASTASQHFPFQNNSFQFPNAGHDVFTFGSGPGFKPPVNSFDAPPAPFSASGSHRMGNNAGSGEFNFSSPSFNVAAPVFNPAASVYSAGSEQPANSRTKIFDDADISQASKSAKKSKAIPIVRPDDSTPEKRDRDEKAPSGKSSDRHKRARRGDAPSDEEAPFSPGHALTESNAQRSQIPHAPAVAAEGKENAAPKNEAGTLPVSAHLGKPEERKDTPVSEASTWAPSGTKEEAATGAQESDVKATKQEDATAAPVQAQQQEAPKEQPAKKDWRTALFGSKKTFTFKPSVAEFIPFTVDQPKSAPEPPKKNDLAASVHAVASPPPSPKRETPPPEPVQPVQPVQPKTDKDEQPERVTKSDSDADSPDEDELNAIMEQLNESDAGIERVNTPQTAANRGPQTAAPGPSKEKRHGPAGNRSDPPSPSPGRGLVSHALDVPKLDFDAQSHFAATPSKGFASGMPSPIRKLISQNDQISDWDDVITSGEEEKLEHRSKFFDRRINDLVGSVVDDRLSPLERALSAIQQSVSAITLSTQNKLTWRSTSAEGEESDADDEDDEYDDNASYRERSPHPRDRKLDRLKNVILEVLAQRDTQEPAEKPENTELVQLRDSVAELQAMTTEKLAHDPTAGLREMLQEVVANQFSVQNARPSDADEIGADSLMLQIDGLKNMLRLTDERAEQEYKLRREAQDSMAELQRLLKDVEDDAARHSGAAESAEARFLQFKEEKIPYFEKVQFRADSLEQEHAKLKLTLAEISSKNIELEGTLDEYRVSSDNWKRDSERSKGELEEVKEENKSLRGSIDHLKTRIEDGMSIRHNLSEKLDRLQDEMATASGDIAREQANWRRREEEHVARYNELKAAYSREQKLREKLEVDISELEQQEREAAKLKFIFGQSQQENARLEELVANLRVENHDMELKAARFEREFNEARESSRVEIQRTRTSMEADVEAANSQVNIVRAELEAQILRLQSQMDNVRLNNDTERERYEMLLEEATETKATALAAAAESREMAVEEQRSMHERVLNDLRERHARALHNSSEDRQRAESHLVEKLELSDDKVHHLQDRVQHLEDKLEIAQSAARAAAEAAQMAKTGPTSAPIPTMPVNTPSMSFNGSMVPEKISPQALRESILVLQDQLQQREGRIDELEQEVASVDKDAPNKLKEKDTEINWLRELLGVRIDDLQDIVNTVSQPSFDHNAVRDAAIRLKANLQMQQQEKERAASGQGLPSLPSLSEIRASPRALPLAAAAAWGSWRKAREGTNSNTSNHTPSKPSHATAFLSGLLTPPNSNRQGLNASASGARRSSESRPLRSVNSTPRPLSSRAAGKMREPPSTPPLLRRSSYDHDAEPTDYDDTYGEAYGEGSPGGENESTADGLVSASPRDTNDGPFGPQITA
ncbi:hypothetical protein P170DRAFT_514095 [Aspergillus steynii IBT 23096]|uniref:Uncharacterized protein n=1 Tax=Aspergillus steynii IBT 23096 TaxID=1392250 RepID=A0A2I2FT07_9EURO|nr:uncharacterized protein P170DRAFT_514095 [Aspergillus steynii IBT 23096]PLB43770.1 hypothetical protein P170DRAFT_514095 [Aspergillus steynii IBT 23096]